MSEARLPIAQAVPNLVENEIVERLDNGGARLRQVGGAKLAPMVTFKATTTLDVRLYEEGLPTEVRAMQCSPSPRVEARSCADGAGAPLP